jgi:RNA polymerase sigma factor (sigma-70 family)
MILKGSDHDLTIQAKNGNKEVFEILFSRYRAPIYHLALSICGNTPLTEDAVQEAFIIAFINIQQLRDPKLFAPWLKRIVTNCCYQLLRKENRYFSYEHLPEKFHLIENSIEDKLNNLANRDALYTALSGIPEKHRFTLMLRYLSNYNSYKEIAEITGVPIGTVRSRLSEGRKQLSARWNNQDDTDHKEFANNGYWNDFYNDIFPQIYTDESYLPKMLSHIEPDMKLIFTSGKIVHGRKVFEESFYDDFAHGSRVSCVNSCISSGNLSVLNLSFENSSEHPHHCPANSFLTVLRSKGKASTIRLFHAMREDMPVQSQFC